MVKKKRGLSPLKFLLLLLCISLLALAFMWTGEAFRQNRLEKFYNLTAVPRTSKVGDILRKEPLRVPEEVDATGHRVLYVSELADRKKVVVSGMIFIPNQDPPAQGRSTVAWAHGTVGITDSCAPSRSATPLSKVKWLKDAIGNNLIVTATDYYGLGTPGTERFLIGRDQSRDVLNSVRAARQIEGADAGNSYIVWGLSQGGQTALFTALVAPTYAPELKLLGMIAAAPAAELVALMREQYKNSVGWVIGPEILATWPVAYPNLNPDQILSPEGLSNYQRVSRECIAPASLEGIVRNFFHQQFFRMDPIDDPLWKKALQEQTPAATTSPLLLIQSRTDSVVLPNTTRLFIDKACAKKTPLNVIWLDGVAHQDTANVAGDQSLRWIGNILKGHAEKSACETSH